MKKKFFISGIWLGLMWTAALSGVLFAVSRLAGLSFAPFVVFEWMTRVLPGPLVTFGIDAMISTMRFLGINVASSAKTAEQLIAAGQFFLLGTAAGAVYFWLRGKKQTLSPIIEGMLLGLTVGGPALVIQLLSVSSRAFPFLDAVWLILIMAGWGIGLAWSRNVLFSTPNLPEEETPSIQSIDRRRFMIMLGAGTATITVLGAGVGALASHANRFSQGNRAADSPTGDGFPNAGDPLRPAPGTRLEYTPVEDHYKVFISLEPPELSPEEWTLPITGLVNSPLTLTLEDLQQNYPARSQYVTLSCISGRIGTSLISTTYWTGVSLRELLDEAGVKDDAAYLQITSADGYHETIPLELIYSDARIMLCYAWDGAPLPVEHGYPLRIWIPDRFGMKQPKWITGIEVTDQYKEGYWVERSWDETARVRTTSVIDTVAVDDTTRKDGQTLVPIGGIAFAGAREISRVEVRVDGEEWREARLRAPLSETTWVVWRYDWPFQPGSHTFEVRCYDGSGQLQVLENTPARPDGATGIHSVQETLS